MEKKFKERKMWQSHLLKTVLIKHDDYLHCLQTNVQLYSSHKCIRSNAHQLHTQHVNKLSLTCLDDKRYMMTNESSIRYGHHKISKL